MNKAFKTRQYVGRRTNTAFALWFSNKVGDIHFFDWLLTDDEMSELYQYFQENKG